MIYLFFFAVSLNHSTMEEVLLRFPHLGKKIFGELDDIFLTDCKIIGKSWKEFIDENKMVPFRIVNKYTNCKESSLKKFCSKANVETIANQSMKDCEEFKINQSKFAGYTLLHAAASNGHLLNCQLMIENLLDIMPKSKNLRWKNRKEDRGMTPFHLAASKGHLKICELFMRHIDEEHPKGEYGESPLYLAAENGHFEVCKLIIDNVSDKNPGSAIGVTPLHKAACYGHFDICRLIMDLNNLDLETECSKD